MEIKSDELHAALVDVLVKGVSGEARDKMLADAMRSYLFEPKKNQYGSETATPLSQAFQKALDDAARKASMAWLDEPAQKEAIRAKVEEALRVAFDKADFAKGVVNRIERALKEYT